jgi:hypothetical protein
MARSRDDDDYEERMSSEPPRRRRDDYEDDYDRGEERRRYRGEETGLDRFFRDQFVLAILLSIFCNVCFIMTILGFVEAANGQDPTGKKNGQICAIVSLVLSIASIGISIAMQGAILGLRR